MNNFLGEFECRLDSKSRISLPAGLHRQLPPEAKEHFVINRGFEKHLTLYHITQWEIISTEINRLNLYVKKNRQFARYFFRGASELKLDSNNRLLLPKRLLDYADIQEKIVLFAYSNRIEVWAEELYNELIEDEPEDFAYLAEEIMGSPSADLDNE
jgi:MraZ protein